MTKFKYSFSRSKKLKSRKGIARLFQTGRASFIYPVKVLYDFPLQEAGDKSRFRVAVTVSKRNVRLAVHRNQIKRQMREAVRLNQELLVERPYLELMFIYVGKPEADHQQIRQAIRLLMEIHINQ